MADREILLREYCRELPVAASASLFEERDGFRDYLDRGWLTLSFNNGLPCVRASHFVGLMPYLCADGPRLLLVLPKGCRENEEEGLLRFLDLVAISNGESPPPVFAGYQGARGSGRFLLFLAAYYSHLLRQLCRRDFRLYYHPEEGELRTHLRGRLRLTAHIRNVLAGKAHHLPCRWEEFTPDNWDNRILLGTVRHLQRMAAVLGPEAVGRLQEEFRGIEPWFSAVAEVSVGPGDFTKARLSRTSQHYRHALEWAQLIVQGMARPTAAGQAPPLVLDANATFERFAEIVVRSAIRQLPGRDNTLLTQDERLFLTGSQVQRRCPDLLIQEGQDCTAVGDAKYKEVMEGLADDRLGDLEGAIIPCISSADWNQLYVYMRLTGASRGFFLVPFWRVGGSPIVAVDKFNFIKGPLDTMGSEKIRVAVFGLNLMIPADVLRPEALSTLTRWFEDVVDPSPTRTDSL